MHIRMVREGKTFFVLELLDADGRPTGTSAQVVKGHGDPPHIAWIEVAPDRRRRGIGTQIYEAATRISCKKWKVPLYSDVSLPPEVEAFWQKQVAKGRAQRIRDARGRDVYRLFSCGMTNLSGLSAFDKWQVSR